MKRLITSVVCLAVSVAALFYAGGGWYFAGQIAAAGLTVRHQSPDRSLEVVRAGARTVTLVETVGDVPALDTDLTYGLAWEGGYGQVFGLAKINQGEGGGDEVTRRLTVLDGKRPKAGDMVGLERDAFPTDAPALAVSKRVQNVKYAAGGGTFPAVFVPGGRNSWVIFTHGGLGSTRTEALRAMATTVDMGMPSLAIGYRNDEGVPGDPSGRYRHGRTEWRDLEGAVQYALGHGAKDVVLVGYSMGGAITASFLQQSPLSKRVSRVVLNSPMLDFGETVDFGDSQRTLPLIGHVPPSLIWAAKQMAAMRYDVDWDAVDYLNDSDWLTVPALVFHGDEDTKVPLSTSEAFADDHPDLVTLVTVRDAGHVEAWNQRPQEYDRNLRAFLNRRPE